MQRCVIPRLAMPAGELFEPGDELFREQGGIGLVSRVTIIHAAAERPRVSSGAMAALVLPRASFPVVERPLRGWGFIDQERGFDRRHKERVPIVFESAAPARKLAHRSQQRHRLVELSIERLEARRAARRRVRRPDAAAGSARSVISASLQLTIRSLQRCRAGHGPNPGRPTERDPNRRESQRFLARTARSGIARGEPDRRCSRQFCPRRCNRLRASRPSYSGRRPAARTWR